VNQPTATQLWKDGPRRMFSSQAFMGGRPYATAGLRGYVGAFVCDRCRQQTYKVLGCFDCAEWVCVDCAALPEAGTASRPLSFQIEK
jgi:hypothetical protein